eukprot:1453948-Amphidinium_carterae.1
MNQTKVRRARRATQEYGAAGSCPLKVRAESPHFLHVCVQDLRERERERELHTLCWWCAKAAKAESGMRLDAANTTVLFVFTLDPVGKEAPFNAQVPSYATSEDPSRVWNCGKKVQAAVDTVSLLL